MSKKRLTLISLIFAVLAALGVIAVNCDVTIRQGVNGRYHEIHMPLYAKWTQFLARHYEYKRLSREITRGCGTDEEKVIAILRWTRDNIKDVPSGMPLFDDHIANITIRGYGTPEQFQDVFTTLCAYAKIPAFWCRVTDRANKGKYSLSFVDLGRKLCVFDAYRGVYFRTKSGEISGIEDIMADRSIVSGGGIEALDVKGVPYKEFYYNLDHIVKPSTPRPERQMPFQRLIYETKKALGIEEKEDQDL